MNLSLVRFDRLSVPVQSLVLVALSAVLYLPFAIAGDLPRGALVWTFSGALMIALNAQRDKACFGQLGPPAVIMLMLHLPLVVWNPLKGAPFFGGIIQPIALVDGCIDYAFVWSWLKVFKKDE